MTLWFVDSGSAGATAYAWNAARRSRDNAKNINLGPGVWTAGVAFRNTVWFVNDPPDPADSAQAVAFDSRTRSRVAILDIDLGPGRWGAAASDGTTLWFVDGVSNVARARNPLTRARDRGRDISVAPPADVTAHFAGTSDGSTLWFADENTNEAAAWDASSRTRAPAEDISLGAGGWGAAVSTFI